MSQHRPTARLSKLVAMGAALCLVMSCLFMTAQSASKDEPTLLPTEALHKIFEEMKGQGSKQKEIAAKFLAQVKTADLSADEQFALAEVYFAAIMPKEAKAAYQKFASGNDLKARLAWQRVLWITMASEQIYDSVENQLGPYRAKFPAVKDDLFHLQSAVFGVADKYREQGNHEKAVKLVTEEIKSLPGDAPYYSYALAATFFDSFKKVGQEEAAIQMLEKARDIYAAAWAKLGAADQGSDASIAHRAGAFHRVEEGLRSDYPPAKQLDLTLKRMLDRVNATLANAKKKS